MVCRLTMYLLMHLPSSSGRAGLSGRLNGGRRHASQEEQGQRHLGRSQAHQAGRSRGLQAGEARIAAAASRAEGALGAGTYAAKHIIVATGARPRVLPGLETDGKLVWTYFEAMVPKEMPKIASRRRIGAIGIEFASFYNAMGVDVTVVEIVDQIMPVEDAEIAKIAQKQLEKQGLKIRTGAKGWTNLKKGTNDVAATIVQGGKSERSLSIA